MSDDLRLKLPHDTAEALAEGDAVDGWRILEDEIIDEWRWGVVKRIVVQKDGVLGIWAYEYQEQTGDNYYNSVWDEDDLVEFYAVRPVTKTVIEYEPIKGRRMIREAQRNLADATNPEPVLKYGKTKDGQPVVSVDLCGPFAGNPSWGDGEALENFAWELMRMAGWLYDKGKRASVRFTPRKEEIARVVDVMERDTFASGEAMAKALILEVVDMLTFREWYAIAHRGAGPNAWGPWASEADAESARTKYLGVLVPEDPADSAVVKLRPVYGMDHREDGGFGFCVQEGCGHPASYHAMAGSSRGRCVICKNSGQSTCDKYMAEKAKPKAKSRAKKEVA